MTPLLCAPKPLLMLPARVKPRLLDLFCCAGGATKGYQRAGFHVTGVDIEPQPHYCGDRFIQGDALEYLAAHGHEYDAIHASPPCQEYSAMRKGRWQDRQHPDLIGPVRELLKQTGKPYIIENVEGAPLKYSIFLCGTMFGLQTPEGSQLRRHRLFETSFPIRVQFGEKLYCRHNNGSAIGVYGGGRDVARRRPATIGVWGHAGGASQRDGLDHYGIDARRQVMGIDWTNGDELSEAIPPAYTEFLGKHLMAAIA